MPRQFKIQKTAILVTLGGLILSDVALGAYSWNRPSEQNAQRELALMQKNVSLLKADISRVKEIQREIPSVQRDCDEFERSLYRASSGYSSVNAELTDLAAKSGLRLASRSFHASDIKGWDLFEVDIDTPVSGNYHSIVHFLNLLQRSPNMYTVLSLSAHSSSANQAPGGLLGVSIHIKTYWRTAG
jgi:Tfp pilus assembly protein PilO